MESRMGQPIQKDEGPNRVATEYSCHYCGDYATRGDGLGLPICDDCIVADLVTTDMDSIGQYEDLPKHGEHEQSWPEMTRKAARIRSNAEDNYYSL